MGTQRQVDTVKPDKRRSTLRRQMNEGFCAPDGSWSPVKTVAIFGQIALLYHFGLSFSELMGKPESLMIVLGFLICPDIFKKFISMRYGNGHADNKK